MDTLLHCIDCNKPLRRKARNRSSIKPLRCRVCNCIYIGKKGWNNKRKTT